MLGGKVEHLETTEATFIVDLIQYYTSSPPTLYFRLDTNYFQIIRFQ